MRATAPRSPTSGQSGEPCCPARARVRARAAAPWRQEERACTTLQGSPQSNRLRRSLVAGRRAAAGCVAGRAAGPGSAVAGARNGHACAGGQLTALSGAATPGAAAVLALLALLSGDGLTVTASGSPATPVEAPGHVNAAALAAELRRVPVSGGTAAPPLPALLCCEGPALARGSRLAAGCGAWSRFANPRAHRGWSEPCLRSAGHGTTLALWQPDAGVAAGAALLVRDSSERCEPGPAGTQAHWRLCGKLICCCCACACRLPSGGTLLACAGSAVEQSTADAGRRSRRMKRSRIPALPWTAGAHPALLLPSPDVLRACRDAACSSLFGVIPTPGAQRCVRFSAQRLAQRRLCEPTSCVIAGALCESHSLV